MDTLYGLLAAIGVMAAAAFVGLYQSGFFHWYAKRLPDNAILNLFFGA